MSTIKKDRLEQNSDLDQLEDSVRDAVLQVLMDLADQHKDPLHAVQPPVSILEAAAIAATQVFMAFERGYRMPGDNS